MPHRTINAETAFWGDGRETANWKTDTRKQRKSNVTNVWKLAFSGEAQPHGLGVLPNVVYPRLRDAGWKFSSRYGWRHEELQPLPVTAD